MWKEGLLAAAGAGVLCLIRSEYEKQALSVEETVIESGKIKKDRTLVFLSDLHDNEFGRDNERLLTDICQVKPDAVLCGGDMLVTKNGRADTRVAASLFSALTEDYPVYCGNGNHESRMTWYRNIYGSRYEDYRDELTAMGVVYLENTSAFLSPDIQITGVDLERQFYEKLFFRGKAAMEADYLEKRLGRTDGSFRILLAHSPLYFDEYRRWGADLTLSGHFHGGTVRIPGLGGLMTPQYQFFVPVCGGAFEKEGHFMVVSRGLGTHSINIRLNNRPQLVVLRLKAVENPSVI